MKNLLTVLLGIMLWLPAGVNAGTLFNATITQTGGSTITVGFNNLESLTDTLTESYLQTNLTGYSDTLATTFVLDWRGLPVTLAYAGGANGALTLNIPATGLTKTFGDGTTSRDANQKSLEDWFKTNGGAEVTKLMQALIAKTANDPIAGNPNSMQATFVASDFDTATGVGNTSQNETTTRSDGKNQNTIGIGLDYSQLDQAGHKNKRITIPLKYTYVSDSDSRKKYMFTLPISQSEVENAKSYSFGLGVAITFPINEEWMVVPSFSYGLVGSIDLGAAAKMMTYSLSSQYVFKKGEKTYTIGNMVGHYKSIPFKAGDYEINPEIANTVFRNGVMVRIPRGSEEKGAHAQFFVIDTRYTGTKLYIDQYNELGAAYGFSKKVRVGASYLTSSNSKGYSVNFGFKF